MQEIVGENRLTIEMMYASFDLMQVPFSILTFNTNIIVKREEGFYMSARCNVCFI